MDFKVKCIKIKEELEVVGFSVGNYYWVRNGKILDDDNDLRPISGDVFETFESLCKFYRGNLSFELVSTENIHSDFNINSLKSFMLVKTRDGHMFLVSESKKQKALYDENFIPVICLEDYDNDLNCCFSESYDIVEVYDIADNLGKIFKFSTESRNLIWAKNDTLYLTEEEIREKFKLPKEINIKIKEKE